MQHTQLNAMQKRYDLEFADYDGLGISYPTGGNNEVFCEARITAEDDGDNLWRHFRKCNSVTKSAAHSSSMFG
jgi:hypothetical protein